MKTLVVDEVTNTGILILKEGKEYRGTIIWDVDVDGPIPASVMPDIRWLKRVGNKLEIDAALKAVVGAADTAKTNKENARAALSANLRAYNGTSNPNQTLVDLITYLGIK